MAENSKLTSFGSNHHYLECIKAAYDFASGELLNLVKEKVRSAITCPFGEKQQEFLVQ